MAKKKQMYKPNAGDPKKVGKSYKAQSIPFAELEEKTSVVGTYQRRRQINIKDRISKEPKDIWIYIFSDVKTGDKFAITGRTMLDQAFDEMIEAEGGEDHVIGLDMRINRGENERTSGGFDMGTYEIMVLE